MKIFVTGMTSSQTNPAAHHKSTTFAGQMVNVLKRSGHDVSWRAPHNQDADDTLLSEQDLVIVGIAPFLALGAHHAYPALYIIADMLERAPEKLRFFVDAPLPQKITASMNVIKRDPSKFTKDFFKARPFYDGVIVNSRLRDRLISTLVELNSTYWPKTLVPAFPWQLSGKPRHQLINELPEGAWESALPVNFDQTLWLQDVPKILPTSTPPWAYAPTVRSKKWKAGLNITRPLVELPTTFRLPTEEPAFTQLVGSCGSIFEPSGRITWWNPRARMSLGALTPVSIDWAEIHPFGRDSEWQLLPSAIEALSISDGINLAMQQRVSYDHALLSLEEQVKTITDPLKENTYDDE